MKVSLKKISGVIFAASLPLIAGCGGGGGALAALGALFTGGGLAALGGAAGASGAASAIVGGGETLALLSNPEPATMLLMGSGLAAMALYRNKKK